MVVIGKPRVDSVENFLQENAIQPELIVDTDTTDTASVASTSRTQSSVQGVVITLRAARKQVRQQRYPRPTDTLPSKKQGMGVRKWRRHQNTLGLLSGITEEDSLEDSFAEDIAEASSSGFAELFENPSKMQIWEKFTRLPESEQWRILQAVAEDFERHNHGFEQEDEEVEAQTPEQCFRRIDRNLRRLVARRSPPVEIIEPMEDELLEFFGERPRDILDVDKPDTYQRMLLHALCQYCGLLSKSIKSTELCRMQVKNRSRDGLFHRPAQRLSVFLAERYC